MEGSESDKGGINRFFRAHCDCYRIASAFMHLSHWLPLLTLCECILFPVLSARSIWQYVTSHMCVLIWASCIWLPPARTLETLSSSWWMWSELVFTRPEVLSCSTLNSKQEMWWESSDYQLFIPNKPVPMFSAFNCWVQCIRLHTPSFWPRVMSCHLSASTILLVPHLQGLELQL